MEFEPKMPPVALVEPQASVDYRRTREMTIDEILLENRVVFLTGEINYASATRVMMQMLYLEDQKKGQPINFYINCFGGAVDDTLAIYDTMRFISSEVATYCIGRAYSGAAVLLAAGDAGKRYILPHAKVMIHQPHGGVTGQTTDIQIQAEQILKSKRVLNEILAKHTGQDVETVASDGERDKFFSADEAPMAWSMKSSKSRRRRSERQQHPGSHRGRVFRSGRTRLRHLLAPSERPNRLCGRRCW